MTHSTIRVDSRQFAVRKASPNATTGFLQIGDDLQAAHSPVLSHTFSPESEEKDVRIPVDSKSTKAVSVNSERPGRLDAGAVVPGRS